MSDDGALLAAASREPQLILETSVRPMPTMDALGKPAVLVPQRRAEIRDRTGNRRRRRATGR